MKAFRLCQQIIAKGLDNSVMTEYRHSSDRSIQDFFGDYSVTGKVLEDGDELLAVWGDEKGESRIDGIADVVLTQSKTEKIYLYCIE
jgi:hypothetical protein